MKPFSLNIRGRLVSFDRPAVMGIINITPDSFFSGSRVMADEEIAAKALAMVEAGADILDVGAYSSRPGAGEVSVAMEKDRLRAALSVIRTAVGPLVPVSVDTFRASVAADAVSLWGADIVNDISGGALDERMFDTVAQLKAPYILMHMRGTPATMQSLTDYSNVTADVIRELSAPLHRLEELGVADIIIDPGFGFAKTVEQNYELMRNLRAFELLGRPVLVGISRKSMLTRLLGIEASEALPATTALNTYALMQGAAVLRVHDVREARQAVEIVSMINSCHAYV